MSKLSITVVGAGVTGLWQAYELARRGHTVTLREAGSEVAPGAASRFAGAMLAPYCEAEAAPPLVQQLGLDGLDLWRAAYPGVVQRGSIVVTTARDRGELDRFARMTGGHRWVERAELEGLEPELAGRFTRSLYFPEEAHISPRVALAFLVAELRRLGATLRFDDPVPEPIWQAAAAGEAVIDCRGFGARGDLADLRGVRGEMAVVRADEVQLSRPVRLLHPRFPLYVVPWGEHHYMVGATMVERDDMGAVTVRSALDLLGAAFAVHPGFAEAEIVELGAGVRPAFPDNVPRIVIRGRRILVNGAYRHGYLLAPVLARAVADHLETGSTQNPLFNSGQGTVTL
jgi:glycine oxidase